MNLDLLRIFSESNVWALIGPEIALMCLGVFLIIADLFTNTKSLNRIALIALVGQIGLLGFCGMDLVQHSLDNEIVIFSGMIGIDYQAQFIRVFILFSTILVTILGMIYFNRQARNHYSHVEFFSLTLFAGSGFMLLTEARHFLIFFVILEAVTISLYILVGYAKNSIFSLEAGIKYLVQGAFSSAILLYGIVLLYGMSTNPNLSNTASDGFSFYQIFYFIATNPPQLQIYIAVTLILSGVAFKIGAVPFQIWIPDVYQGAPTPITAFLSVVSKTAGFVVLMNLIKGPFISLAYYIYVILTVLACASIIFSNLAALSQSNVKRLMGLSGISHAGYLLIGVIAAMFVRWGQAAVMFYLFIYLLGSFLVFGVMSWVSGDKDHNQKFEDYIGLARKSPFLSFLLTIGLGSLAGIPPLAGFIAKVMIFIAAFQAKLYGLLAVGIIGVILSITYYFAWIRQAIFKSPQDSILDAQTPPLILEHPKLFKSFKLLFGSIAILVITLGLYQKWLIDFFF